MVEIVTSIRQNPSVASFSPVNALAYFVTTVCLSALLDGKTYVLPRHIESLVPILATHTRLLYYKDIQIDSRLKVIQTILDSFPAVI